MGDVVKFLSTPSARRATQERGQAQGLLDDFYPRPPRGGRLRILATDPGNKLFLSTPSARRATIKKLPLNSTTVISIHALREEGDRFYRLHGGQHRYISIHALREEGDLWPSKWVAALAPFLSTPSARRATRRRQGDDHG